MSRANGLLPASLRFRVRLAVFVPALIGLTVAAFRPLSAVLAEPRVSATALLGTSAAVLVFAVLLVVVADIGSRVAAQLAVRDLDRLRADVRRAAAAESRDRRGDAFLASKAEFAEVAQLRAEARALLHACRLLRQADHTVLGAAIHDVKAGLSGLAHLLDAEPLARGRGEQPCGELVATSRDEARRLLGVLTAMITFLRSSRDEVPHLSEVDLGEIVRRVVSMCQYQRPDVRLAVEVRGEPVVRADPTLLTQALTNLVENATRMARSSVAVSVFPGVVRVEDDGPGLPGELSRLGGAFVADDVPGERGEPRRGSLGLGLYIAQRVLEAHDGSLTVERSDANGTVLLAYVGRAL